MSTILPWFRIPTWCALDEDPAVAAAAIHLLGRWHLGRHPAVAEMAKAWGWGWDRAGRFMDEMWEWAGEHDAIRPPTARGKSVGGRPASAKVSRSHDRLSTAHLRRSQGGYDEDAGTFRSLSRAPDLLPEKERDEIGDQDPGDPREREAPATLPHAPPPAPPPERVPPPAPSRPPAAAPVDAGARPAPNPVPRAADVRPAAPPPARTADDLYGEAPPEWLDVAGRRVPGNLPAFLDGLVIPRCANVVERIGTTFGVWTTAELLAVPARAWTFGAPDKLALVSRLREHLARRWGPAGVLGVLAPGEVPEARGAPSPRAPARASFHDRYAAAAAELAADEAGGDPDPLPRPGSIDTPYTEVT